MSECMALHQPESMEGCVYFSRRSVGKGSIVAWALHSNCPACSKALMSKPLERGRVKLRAKEYVCPACAHAIEKEAYEVTLTLNVQYTCPSCSFSGETQIPFKRKTYQGVPSFVFSCGKCRENIAITKKMRTAKKSAEVEGA